MMPLFFYIPIENFELAIQENNVECQEFFRFCFLRLPVLDLKSHSTSALETERGKQEKIEGRGRQYCSSRPTGMGNSDGRRIKHS